MCDSVLNGSSRSALALRRNHRTSLLYWQAQDEKMSLQLRQSSHLPGARGCPARPASKKPDNTGRAIAREDLEDKQRNGSLAARVPARGRHPSMVAPRTRTQGPRQAPPFFCLLLLLLILLLQLPGGQTRLRDTRHSAAAPEAFCWRMTISIISSGGRGRTKKTAAAREHL